MRAAADPFGERRKPRARARINVLGADCSIESTDEVLLGLALEAFGGLPQYRLDRQPCRLDVHLVLTDCGRSWTRSPEPPRPALSSGNGFLCATIDAGNFAVVDPSASRALVCISPDMLRHRYYARYELIELALMTLASRAQSLVPLHAACIGLDRSGLLLMGASGSGKSTLGLHALAQGMRLLSEDSAFVGTSDLLITGVPNYLHVEPSAIGFLEPGMLAQRIQRSPVIRRRSGTRKFELDLRETPGRLARKPLQLAATIFLSRRPAGRQPPLKPLTQRACLNRLRREQSYALGFSNWSAFERRVAAEIPSYELRRTEHPDIAIQELRTLLGSIS